MEKVKKLQKEDWYTHLNMSTWDGHVELSDDRYTFDTVTTMSSDFLTTYFDCRWGEVNEDDTYASDT